jgi:hypothetical protein
MDADASLASNEHANVMQARGVHVYAYGEHVQVIHTYTLHVRAVYCLFYIRINCDMPLLL